MGYQDHRGGEYRGELRSSVGRIGGRSGQVGIGHGGACQAEGPTPVGRGVAQIELALAVVGAAPEQLHGTVGAGCADHGERVGVHGGDNRRLDTAVRPKSQIDALIRIGKDAVPGDGVADRGIVVHINPGKAVVGHQVAGADDIAVGAHIQLDAALAVAQIQGAAGVGSNAVVGNHVARGRVAGDVNAVSETPRDDVAFGPGIPANGVALGAIAQVNAEIGVSQDSGAGGVGADIIAGNPVVVPTVQSDPVIPIPGNQVALAGSIPPDPIVLSIRGEGNAITPISPRARPLASVPI